MPETEINEQQVDVEESDEDSVEPDEAGADVVSIIENDEEADDATPVRTLAIRHVLERQLIATQTLSEDLVEAVTDVSVAVVHAPAALVDEIRGGATLPTAVANTGTAVREVVNTTGGRVRHAVGGYVSARATLPNAVVVGGADVAESVVRAQGIVAATAVNGAFTVATVAARGGDVRGAFVDERREVRAQVVVARDDVVESWRQAREHVDAARNAG